MNTRHQTMTRTRARPRFSTRAAILAAIVSAILVAAVFPVRTYLSERSEIASLTAQTRVLEHENRVLQRQIERLHDPDYLERLARECLGMVKPGEVSFVIVPKGGDGPRPASC